MAKQMNLNTITFFHKLVISRLPFICLLGVLLLTSCDKDDDPKPAGTISLQADQTSYEGPRGTEMPISITAIANYGIKSIIVTPQGQVAESFPVPDEAKSLTIEVTMVIPADALLGDTYMLSVEMTDKQGATQNLDVEVLVSPVLSMTPDSYSFQRDGISTVSYTGQNERLDMVEQITDYLKTGDGGAALSVQVLTDAYANVNGNGHGFYPFTSTKQLKNKSFQPDLDNMFMSNLFLAAEQASISVANAANGTAGLLVRENSGNTILLDANGREFTQLIEKGLMGTVMYNQIFNTYFSDARTGDDVENTELSEGKNYTSMEHHWDEAFGYWNPPVDFTSNWPSDRSDEDRFWSHYSNVVDPFLGTNNIIVDAFIAGRTAIVNNDLPEKNLKRAEIAEQLELVAAATTVHYINSTLSALNEAQTGEAFHTLSEAWAFANAIKYNPTRKLSLEDIEMIKEEHFGSGGNFWNVTPSGLNQAKSMLIDTYPALAPYQDDL
ncbi:MAG: DUF4856 domain-containing protein [Saprospiraceae bacterium]|nr:DUF4856 domain-containing protein [Saprospiraceae bacterium]